MTNVNGDIVGIIVIYCSKQPTVCRHIFFKVSVFIFHMDPYRPALVTMSSILILMISPSGVLCASCSIRQVVLTVLI